MADDTLFDWDERGEMSPWVIEEPESVDARRERVGLPPLAKSLRERQERSRRKGEGARSPYRERQAEIRAWARRAGWLEP